ncbi:UNVERIFIED_CONTAM: hypothetical protein Scaly_1788600 [Sesamum calycinum]|uniref:Uncharacterized protein n=1 Tax=Sesamum calycinum TaxID=2727403 RepID=A0AAW2NZA7_9LAMI
MPYPMLGSVYTKIGWQDHFNYWDQEEQLRYQPPPSPMQAAPQTPNSGMSLEDIVKSLALTTLQLKQDTMAGFKSLGNQISQLATSISKLEAQASQQTEVNPENASAMTPQSREELHMIEQAPADTSEDEKTLEYTKYKMKSMPKSEEDEKEITLNKVKINITPLDLKALPYHLQYLFRCKLSSSWLGRFEAVNVFPHGVARIKSLATRQIFKVKGHRSKSFLGGDEVTTSATKHWHHSNS